MTSIAQLTMDLSAVDADAMSAADLLREVERIAHRIDWHDSATDLIEIQALQIVASRLKARIGARVAALTVLRDAIRSAARQREGHIGTYDAAGRRRL